MYRLKIDPYQRRFRRPIVTHHGVWTVRQGAILTLLAENGDSGQGEIAPLAWFGSETLSQALAFCAALETVTPQQIGQIPDRLPACQFAFESALQQLLSGGSPVPTGQIGLQQSVPSGAMAGLLSAGPQALEQWPSLYATGTRTFKWKIGVASLQEELQWFAALCQQLPADGRLRLDANGGLSVAAAQAWLRACADRPVEFLEQPLPPSQFDAMLQLSQDYTTPLALDESVATVAHLQRCYECGWRGVFVIKPAIAGSPARLRQFCRTHAIEMVFSSVFETEIGRQAGLQLAWELDQSGRALGYGPQAWWETEA
jgi:O-succinylbenzoate synthase